MGSGFLTFWLVPFAVDKVTKVLVVLGHPGVCYCGRLWGWTILEVFKELGNTAKKNERGGRKERRRPISA